MMKLTVGLAFLVLCVSVQAQTPRPDLRQVCRRQNERCLSRENRNGRTNEVTNIFNSHCRESNRNWRNVTRCELARANCQLTLVSCSTLSCANVRRTLAGGGDGGGRTTPRSPTDPDSSTPRGTPTRTPRPRTTTRRTRTTTRRTPTTRRGGRSTTRRTPTTRRGGRTTTRRTPTTRRGGRTTTRRTPTTRRGGRTTTRRTPTTRRGGRRTTTPRIPTTRTPRPPIE